MNNQEMLDILEKRFKENINRHKLLSWEEVEEQILKKPVYLQTLIHMEETGGEPDVIYLDQDKDSVVFIDCSKESPKGRRSVCYDQEALESRKKFPPKHSAMQMAKQMGIDILDEKEYQEFQTYGSFDSTTSSWIITPKKIRDLGGALFCDFRYDTVFTYHNGADSYYGSRGFRGKLVIR